MNKKLILTGAALIIASPLSFAGSINASCVNGVLGVELVVAENEACNVTQNTMINGISETVTLPISSTTTNEIELSEGDTAMAMIQMSCTSPYGESKANGSVSTNNGCSGQAIDFPEAPDLSELQEQWEAEAEKAEQEALERQKEYEAEAEKARQEAQQEALERQKEYEAEAEKARQEAMKLMEELALQAESAYSQ